MRIEYSLGSRGSLAFIAILLALVASTPVLAQGTCPNDGGWVGTPAPVGTYNHYWQCGQIRAAHGVLAVYNCDWAQDTAELSPFMRRHMVSRMKDCNNCVGQIVIEPTDSPELDDERRIAVMNYLARWSFHVPPEAITVGYTWRDRLRGEEASRVLDKFDYQQTRTQSSQFNPYSGYAAPIGSYAPLTGGGPFPAVQGFYTP